jgi:hypothetical protein
VATQPRYISQLVSYQDHFVFQIFDTHKKRSPRGVKVKDQARVDFKYECVEAVVGKVGETYPDVARRAEERLSALNAQEST